MIKSSTIEIVTDTAELDSALRSLESLPELCSEIAFSLTDGSIDFSQLISLDADDMAAGTGQLRIFFKPSDFFLELLSAGRAENV